jgi:hypothetical protein
MPHGNKCDIYGIDDESRLQITRLVPYNLLRYKIAEGFLHSMNAPASALGDLRGEKPLALSFR